MIPIPTDESVGYFHPSASPTFEAKPSCKRTENIEWIHELRQFNPVAITSGTNCMLLIDRLPKRLLMQ